jgi:RluA family pseudouridine synthase
MTLHILFEDKWLIAINKPANIHTTSDQKKSDGESTQKSILDLTLEQFPETKSIYSKTDSSPLLQRLDYETSGVLLIARSKESWQKFRELFKTKSITKKYLILVEGKTEKEQPIKCKIGARYRRSKKVQVHAFNKNTSRTQLADSLFELLKYDQDKNYSLVCVTTSTGVRHQVRAQAAYLKHPLVGDTLYGSKESLNNILSTNKPSKYLMPSFFLHAQSILFTHPFTEAKTTIKAQLPEYAKKIANNFYLS